MSQCFSKRNINTFDVLTFTKKCMQTQNKPYQIRSASKNRFVKVRRDFNKILSKKSCRFLRIVV